MGRISSPSAPRAKNGNIKKKKAEMPAVASKKLKTSGEYLAKLKKDDPEFYKAVMSSKDIIDCGSSDDEDGDDDDVIDEEDRYETLDDIENEADQDDSIFPDEFEEEDHGDSGESDNEDETDDEAEDAEFENEDAEFEEEDAKLEEEDEDNAEVVKNSVSKKRKMEEEQEEEEEDEEDEHLKGNTVNASKLEKWHAELQSDKNPSSAFRDVCQAIRAAIESIQGSEKIENKSSMKVVGPQVFNDVVRLCLKDVAPAMHRMFGCKSLSDQPKKNKRWAKLHFSVKSYLKDLILLTQCISEPSAIEVILKKGILPIIPFYLEFNEVAWSLLKHLATLWCTSEEKVRVLAFIAIFRLTRAFKEEIRDKALKVLYLSYVKNCRFTSPNTWPMIDFMRVSLVELYCIDQALAYRHSFVYIRQMAFHLRNAMVDHKEERIQLVYNWQYIHCLHMWADLLCKAHPSPILKPLIYPLVQIANGTMQLVKTPRYYPLVLRVTSILTDLSHQTSTFVPVLPFLLEILSNPKLLVKPHKEGSKSLEWPCIIKLSQAQLEEVAFTEGVIDQLYSAFYKYLSGKSFSIGFPELVFPATLKIKTYLKKCRVASYAKKIRQLLEKIQENSEYITQRRRGVNFTISESKSIKDWEISCQQSGPPLLVFYEQWKKKEGKEGKDSLGFPKAHSKKKNKSSETDDDFSLKTLRKKQMEGLEPWEAEEEKPTKSKIDIEDIITELKISEDEDDGGNDEEQEIDDDNDNDDDDEDDNEDEDEEEEDEDNSDE